MEICRCTLYCTTYNKINALYAWVEDISQEILHHKLYIKYPTKLYLYTRRTYKLSANCSMEDNILLKYFL